MFKSFSGFLVFNSGVEIGLVQLNLMFCYVQTFILLFWGWKVNLGTLQTTRLNTAESLSAYFGGARIFKWALLLPWCSSFESGCVYLILVYYLLGVGVLFSISR